MKQTTLCILILCFSRCAFSQEVTPSATPLLSPPPAPSPVVVVVPPPPVVAVPAPPSTERRFRNSVSIFYSGANSVKFDKITGMTSNGVSIYGNATFNTESTAGVGYELSYTAPEHWGWSAGLNVDGERKINSATAVVNGSYASVVYVEPKATLSMLSVYGNAVYSWEHFYIPFGLNISVPDFNSTDGSMTNINSGVGVQFGVGWLLGQNLAIDIQSRLIEFNFTRAIGGTYYNYGNGTMTGLMTVLKFNF